MASTIKVDNVQNTPGTNIASKCGTTVTIGAASDNIRSAGNNLQASDGGNLISQSGTDITLGASGDTINLASGASQTGFGRTGTVDWDTSIHTGTVTAATGKGYFVNTTAGGITVNLPAAAVGSIVAVSDYASTAASNNITVAPNGTDKINGANENYAINTKGLAVTLVYADATRGWKSVTGSDADATGVAPYIVATGGTITCSGNDKIHKFTGPGTFTVCSVATCAADNLVSYMVVAGGGGGGQQEGAGGGGAGGFRELVSPTAPYTASPLNGYPTPGNRITVTATGYPITVGAGGAVCNPHSLSGSGSTFSCITAAGGGGAGSHNQTGYNGGSGGGGSGRNGTAAGAGNTPPTTPAQGFTGGPANPAGTNPDAGGGGGGATVAGQAGFGPVNPTGGGPGGNGATTQIMASPIAYAGGGGGGKDSDSPNGGTAGDGGTGGGGDGGSEDGSPRVATAGTPNTGGGGGGGGSCVGPSIGQAGGSGVVVIRYKFQ
jgi:hypothetical protein